MKYKDVILLDWETTGLLEPNAIELEKQPHGIELFCMRLDKKNKVIDEYESFYSVPVKVPKFIQKLTNIKPSMMEGAPQFVEEYKNLVNFFMGANRMVAHNLPFDAGILWAELSRIEREFQFPWPPDWYCTIEHSMSLKNKRLKLGKLHEMLTGEPYTAGAHRAKQDVYALQRCYIELIKRGM